MQEGKTGILFRLSGLAYRSSETSLPSKKSEGHFLENLGFEWQEVGCPGFGWKSLKIGSWLGKPAMVEPKERAAGRH